MPPSRTYSYLQVQSSGEVDPLGLHAACLGYGHVLHSVRPPPYLPEGQRLQWLARGGVEGDDELPNAHGVHATPLPS